ncbi:protein STPG3 [Protopterus annectens]|uniref:protein STPG3 n=1 Tax=Protopterus annectens TaxID=7888 RepID=UPI001CFAC790|nr:protein STPG3 [Protopterus annectens]
MAVSKVQIVRITLDNKQDKETSNADVPVEVLSSRPESLAKGKVHFSHSKEKTAAEETQHETKDPRTESPLKPQLISLPGRSVLSGINSSGSQTCHLSPMSVVRLQRSATWIRGSLKNIYNGPLYPMLKPPKMIKWNEAMERRPPILQDMEGPGPTTYFPKVVPLHEIKSPAYSFGRLLPVKDGGGRTSWQKLWFQSLDPYTKKTTFESQWPSPFQYEQHSTLGSHQPYRFNGPSYSIGKRKTLIHNTEPNQLSVAPNKYNSSSADQQVMLRPPAFSMRSRLNGTTLWKIREQTPGPGTYNVTRGLAATKERSPQFTIQGTRAANLFDISSSRVS